MLSIPLIQSLNYHSCTQSDNSINVRRGASYEAARYIKEVIVPRKDCLVQEMYYSLLIAESDFDNFFF